MPSLDQQWMDTGLGVRVRYVSELMDAIGRLGVWEKGRRFVWRGLADARYAVSSSIWRELQGHDAQQSEVATRMSEHAILMAARAWGLGTDRFTDIEDVYLLAQLQHHGTPTRLIDVTRNPNTAAWFACQPAARRTDLGAEPPGVLLAIDVTELSSLSYWKGSSDGLQLTDSYSESWDSAGNPLGWRWSRLRAVSAERGYTPVLIEAAAPDQRLIAQEGLFLASAVPPMPTLKAFPSFNLPVRSSDIDLRDRLIGRRERGRPFRVPFVAIVIQGDKKDAVLERLDLSYGKTRSSLFPDFGGFADALGAGETAIPPRLDFEPYF